uniref:Uncharacterized protein n=1 Tax=Arundo donax TaxID=35708 RepID=A0A0A9HHN6_ARUDO
MFSGLADADWVTPLNHPMPQRKQNLTTLYEVLVVDIHIVMFSPRGLLVQWRLRAVVCFE